MLFMNNKLYLNIVCIFVYKDLIMCIYVFVCNDIVCSLFVFFFDGFYKVI